MQANDISIYEDYNAFIKENDEFISTLIKNNSKTIQRFTHVIKVVQHLYDLHNVKELSSDEEVFFETGFDFIYDQIHILQSIFEIKYNKDYKLLEKNSLAINLLLYINEFKNEALDLGIQNKAFKKLLDLETKVDKAIDEKTNIPEEYFQLLNDIVDELFEGEEISLVTDIFYEIASEYDLIDDTQDDFNELLTEQMELNRNKKN